MGTINRRNGILVFVTFFAVTALFYSRPANAQALAETAGATSVSAGTTAAVAKTLNFATSKIEASPAASQHLQASAGPSPQVVNRRALEEHAGRDASKLLIRSTPPSSQVWIDDKFVGNTPILLILAPGKYRVSFRGSRMESGEQSVDLLPRETRDLALSLSAHYPTKVTFR
jgi:PEGA domain